ncbi:MAG: RDD family protein [Oryzihumus sp.]
MDSATLGVGEDDLVTGEAVALDLPTAGLGMRVLSGALDLFVAGVVLFVLFWLAVLVTRGADDAVAATVFLTATVLAMVVLPTTVETLTRGRSLGKAATGLRTVRDDAGPIGFRHALTRALIGVVEIWLPPLFMAPAFTCALFNRKGKRFGDLAAGTYVVRERVRPQLVAPPQMPWPLASWATTADLAALPDHLAMATRQFLARAGQMSPAARTQLSQELLTDVLRYAAPPPPPGSHPEAVLAAVLADRRRRDTERLQREDQLRRRLMQPDTLA